MEFKGKKPNPVPKKEKFIKHTINILNGGRKVQIIKQNNPQSNGINISRYNTKLHR